ncbi:MAG: ABC transporter substrate-binding protein [Chloroflexi bacterium]|nr:ABC transporter substrate-binding protein [Chloroflexota bacterium]
MGTSRQGRLVGSVVMGVLLATSLAATAVAQDTATVTIVDNHGEITVPVNPARLVALDNTSFQTLSDWEVPVVAVPKPLMYDLWPNLTDDPAILDVGLHREPDLEAVIAAEPDLIIGGYRFGSYYEDLRRIQPATIETNARDGEDHISELKRQTSILGQVFAREADAQAINDALDAAVASAREAYNGTDTVMGLLTSENAIAYAAPGTGRSVGVVFPTLGLVPAIDQEGEDATHGDDISVEAIAAANPDWLIVLDRDGMWLDEGYTAAKELIEGSEALQNVTAVQQGQIIYLAPSFYLDEGIQAYTGLYADIAAAFAAAP